MLIRYKDKKHSDFVNVKMGDCICYKDELFIKIGDEGVNYGEYR